MQLMQLDRLASRWLWLPKDTDIFLLCLAFECFIQHPFMSVVERRQELDMSVSPVWWQAWEKNFANA